MLSVSEKPSLIQKESLVFDNIKTEAHPVNIDGVVNPAMLHAHLALLTRFKMLEQSDEQIDTRYLLRAQERYVLWLNLMNSQNFDAETMPIPPIDVCYIWHSHLLSPLRYYEDMRRIYDPQQKFPDFPLKRLHDIWEKNGSHTDPASERIWVEKTKQSWVLDPRDSSDFKINCPWCKEDVQISWTNYVNMMRAKVEEKCPKCCATHTVGTLSAKRFIDDVIDWSRDRTRFIGGSSLVGLKNGSYSKLSATNDSLLSFNNADSPHIRNLINSASKNWEQCNWKYITEQLNLHASESKLTGAITKNMKKKIIRRILSSYTGIPMPFSMDLISAVHRQREFTGKMVNNTRWINCIDVQVNAIVRYHKFLLLTKENFMLVPTLDIDLAWHTHQIHASLYRAFTQKHTGRIINHDDSVEKSTLSNGLADTERAWYKKYHELYINVKKATIKGENEKYKGGQEKNIYKCSGACGIGENTYGTLGPAQGLCAGCVDLSAKSLCGPCVDSSAMSLCAGCVDLSAKSLCGPCVDLSAKSLCGGCVDSSAKSLCGGCVDLSAKSLCGPCVDLSAKSLCAGCVDLS